MLHLSDEDVRPREESEAATERRRQAAALNDAAMGLQAAETGGPAVETMLRRALKLDPACAHAWGNLGIVLWRAGAGRRAEAEHALRKAIALNPSDPKYWDNLGIFLGAQGDARGAEAALIEATVLDPEATGPKWDLALVRLWSGDWERGLADYEIRKRHRGPRYYPILPMPAWRGEDLNGKTLYVAPEQGIGDRILFSRYIAWVKETWPECRVLACLDDALVNLFWEYRQACELLPDKVPWPEGIDYGVYLCSLPALHGSRPGHVPPDPGFIRRRADRQAALARCKLPPLNLPALKVGICWTGSPLQVRNADRTVPLELLLPLAEDPRVALYGFQCGPGNADLDRLDARELVCDLGPEIEREGWVGTALALLEMDLVVTCCTSIAHLAGALGVPCWTLLCADPYWVWGREETTTAWYPTMRLYRQPRNGGWEPIVWRVRCDLSKLVDQNFS